MATIERVDRNVVRRGESYKLNIFGSGTSFSESSQVSISGGGFSNPRVIFHSPEWLEYEITVNNNAILGGRDLTVTTGSEVVTKTNAIKVVEANTPIIDRVEPSKVLKGNRVVLHVYGKNTWFYGCAPEIYPSGDFTLKEINVIGPEECLIDVEYSDGAELGFRDFNMVR